MSKYVDIEAEHSKSDTEDEQDDKPTESDNEFIDDTPYPEDISLHRLKRFSDIIKGADTQQQILQSGKGRHTTETTTAKSNGKIHEKKKRFHLHAKNIGLTYPQCTLTKEELMNHIREKLQEHEGKIVVCEEDHHETDGKHLHAAIMLEEALQIHKENYFDTEDYHCNIQATRNTTDWLRYVTKDGNYTCHPENYDPKELLTQRSKKKATIGYAIVQDIKQGATKSDLYERYPEYLLLHSKQVIQYQQETKEAQYKKQQKQKWADVINTEPRNPNDFTAMRITGWLNHNVIAKQHKFGSKNLWLYGKTRMGKTSLKQLLNQAGLNMHEIDMGSTFYDGLNDETQLIVYDEFKGQKTITDMNRICDGSITRLNTKGGSFLKTNPTPVLVLSNYTIKDCYSHTDEAHLETLQRRFTEIEITVFLEININVKQGLAIQTPKNEETD